MNGRKGSGEGLRFDLVQQWCSLKLELKRSSCKSNPGMHPARSDFSVGLVTWAFKSLPLKPVKSIMATKWTCNNYISITKGWSSTWFYSLQQQNSHRLQRDGDSLCSASAGPKEIGDATLGWGISASKGADRKAGWSSELWGSSAFFPQLQVNEVRGMPWLSTGMCFALPPFPGGRRHEQHLALQRPPPAPTEQGLSPQTWADVLLLSPSSGQSLAV